MDHCLVNIVKYVPTWSSLKQEELNILRLTGITNAVYGISHANLHIQPSTIIYRTFGSAESNPYLNRKLEVQVIKALMKSGVGPKVYGQQLEYRIEEFLHAEPLPAKQMVHYDKMLKVAQKLNQFHKSKVEQLPEQSPIQKLCKMAEPFKTQFDKMAKKQLFTAEQLEILEQLKPWLNQSIEWLRPRLTQLDQNLVISHNDLLANNILVIINTKQVQFIDFEYCSYNYRAFDIANYFQQSMFDYDVTEPPFYGLKEGLPDMGTIQTFVQLYVLSDHLNPKDYIQVKQPGEMVKKLGCSAAVDRIMKDIPLCLMLCNLYWGSWGISVSKNPKINFDYIRFSRDRMRIFKKIQESFK